MPKVTSKDLPSVVMLTSDRQIDHRIMLEADSLEAAGWQVTIVAMPSDEAIVADDPKVIRIGTHHSRAVRENLVVHAYRWLRHRLPMNGALMRVMKTVAWRFAADQEFFYAALFAETLSRFSPTVFVAHDLPLLPAARQAAERCGARLVYDSHELYCEQEFSARERHRWAEIEAKYIGACDAVISINPSIARELENRYGLQQVHVLYNAKPAVDPMERQWKFHEYFGLDGATKILLFQGGLSANRHLEVLVEAMRLVKEPFVNLVLLGDGQLREKMQRTVSRSSLASRVHFHPAVPQHLLPQYTASADAGVIPYQPTCLNNFYCTPNKLFEFITAGLPILATDLPEIRRIVSFCQIGMVGDTGTPEKLAASIDEFFSDASRLRFWRAQTGEARNTFSWEHEGEKLVEVFKAFR